MGNWSMHIEGHGIHDNGRDDDADAQLRVFAGKLADSGHDVHLATFTSGATKELLNADDTTPFARQHEADDRRPLKWRPRA